nr:FYVE; RhoGEF and PH domain-containing protein 5-like isoform X2 [Biomphalaria glabrata]
MSESDINGLSHLPSRPKFIDKFLLGASSLSRKSSGKLKKSPSVSSQDSSKFYLDFPEDQSDVGSTCDSVSQCSSSFDGHSDHTGYLDVNCQGDDYDDEAALDEVVEDSDCGEGSHTSSEICSQLNVSSEDQSSELQLKNHLHDYSVEEIIYDITDAEQQLITDAEQQLITDAEQQFNSDHEHITKISCNSVEISDSQSVGVLDIPAVSDSPTEAQERTSDSPTEAQESTSDSPTEAQESTSDSPTEAQESTSDEPPEPSLVTKGFVKRQCQVFLQSLQPSESSRDSLDLSRKVKRSSSELNPNSSLCGQYRRPLSPHSDNPDKWSKSLYDISRNNKFTEAVMAKGYVKALSEQINQQGALKLEVDDDDAKKDALEESDEDAVFLHQFKDQGLRQSFVKDLIQAAESQSSKENSSGNCKSPTVKKPGGYDQSPHSEHNSPSSVSCHNLSSQTGINGDSSLNKSTSSNINPTPKLFIKKTPENALSHSRSLHLSQSSSTTKHSPSKASSVRSHSTTSPGDKPHVDYNSKPKKLSLTPELTQMLNVKADSPSESSLAHNESSVSKFSVTTNTVGSPSEIKHSETHVAKHSEIHVAKHSEIHVAKHSEMSEAKHIEIHLTYPNETSHKHADILVTKHNTTYVTTHSKTQTPEHTETHVSSPSSHPTSPISKSSNSSLPYPISSPGTHSAALPSQLRMTSSNESNKSCAGTQREDSESSTSSSNSHNLEVSMRVSSTRSSQQYRDSVFNTIYDNAPALNAAELFDSSWSDSDSMEEFSDGEEKQEERKKVEEKKKKEEEKKEPSVSEQVDVPAEDKRFRIASELLQTERDYVARLHLLHQVFYFTLDKENRQQQMFPPDTLRHMFSNTKSIFLFHNDFLLPQLEDRMKNWNADPRIGDLMKKNAPFLKMYTEYIRNFDRAMKLINQWMEKSVRFSEIIRDIQKKPECGSLSLQHHMLGPIQRVPRYELLLKDYVKHLPENSPDKSDAKDALDLVTKAACHSNEAMKKIETFHKLLDIYQSLRGDVPVDFISPTREFVTQGPVTKISARSGEKQPRQIILFNDMVLVCAYILGAYSVRSVLEVDSLEIKPGNNMHIPNTMMLRSKQKAVELLDENPSGELMGWKVKFEDVIANYKQRKRFIKSIDVTDDSSETNMPESCLGKTAPVWIPDDAATMCMLCQSTFNMVRRRHHCRSCGKLICKSCCKKAPLEYKKMKIDRVCVLCFDVIVNKRGATETSSVVDKKKGVLQVKASDPGLLCGYMHCSTDNGVSWSKLWVSARNDFALYTFRAHEDVSAIGSLPLPGHEVECFGEYENKQNVFGLKHKNKMVFFFQADNDKKMKRWVSLLSKLVKAELPEESSRLSSQSNTSNTSSDNIATEGGNNRNSTHSGSQADSGYPGDSNSSLAALAAEDIDHESADGVSQYDNIDAVVSE